MNWEETTASLGKLREDLKQCWEHLTKTRASAKPEVFTACEMKMKSVEDRLKVLDVVHRRVLNRFNRLCLFVGADPKKQKVHKPLITQHCNFLISVNTACTG